MLYSYFEGKIIKKVLPAAQIYLLLAQIPIYYHIYSYLCPVKLCVQ
jgi:hypothetical protein